MPQDMPAAVYSGPPEAFDLAWNGGRVVNTARGPRRLAKAPETDAFRAAWSAARQDLAGVGFGTDFLGDEVLFWEQPAHDHAAVRAAIEGVSARAAERQAAAAAERDRMDRLAEERRVRDAAFIAEAREDARRSLATEWWAWARRIDHDSAQELVDRPDLDLAGAVRLATLVGQARGNIGRSEKRVAEPHGPEMAHAEDAAVRRAALDAVRSITDDDADRASKRNNIGWSKTTTLDGHVLAAMDGLTVEQASHALRLLRIHHRQVPPYLRGRLFAAVDEPALCLAG